MNGILITSLPRKPTGISKCSNRILGTNYDGGVTESSLPMSGGHLEIRKHLVGFDTKPLGKDSREPTPLRLERGEGLIGNEPCSLRLRGGGGCSQGEDDEISEVTDSTLSEQEMMDILFEAGYTTEEMKGIIGDSPKYRA